VGLADRPAGLISVHILQFSTWRDARWTNGSQRTNEIVEKRPAGRDKQLKDLFKTGAAQCRCRGDLDRRPNGGAPHEQEPAASASYFHRSARGSCRARKWNFQSQHKPQHGKGAVAKQPTRTVAPSQIGRVRSIGDLRYDSGASGRASTGLLSPRSIASSNRPVLRRKKRGNAITGRCGNEVPEARARARFSSAVSSAATAVAAAETARRAPHDRADQPQIGLQPIWVRIAPRQRPASARRLGRRPPPMETGRACPLAPPPGRGRIKAQAVRICRLGVQARQARCATEAGDPSRNISAD